ncbi:hypothetical protein EGM70_05915 [Enterobacteriaceae bacterium 89]|nr:hypothetical protein [Enterobacteriaceae bacterium 89]
MMMIKLKTVCVALSLLLLTGCPWGQVKIYPDETASIALNGDSICFFIPSAQGYYPEFLAVNFRGAPSKDMRLIKKPNIDVINGQLCIPPTVYDFFKLSPAIYIVEVIFQSESNRPRKFVVGFEVRGNNAHDVHLTDMEIMRPYDKIN